VPLNDTINPAHINGILDYFFSGRYGKLKLVRSINND
jgi:hypothetical protein